MGERSESDKFDLGDDCEELPTLLNKNLLPGVLNSVKSWCGLALLFSINGFVRGKEFMIMMKVKHAFSSMVSFSQSER